MMQGMPMGGMPPPQGQDTGLVEQKWPQILAAMQAQQPQQAMPQQGGELAAMQGGQAPGGNSDMLRQMMMQMFQHQMGKQGGNDAAMGAGPM